MPEGHVIHRLAAELESAFGGRTVRVTSPQGRFHGSAALLDGTTFAGAEAYGKNLFIEFGHDLFVQVHLGLIGKLRWVEPGVVQNPDTVRLRIETEADAVELRGPQTCNLIGPDELAAVVATLGPDPLRADADPDRGWQRVHRSGRTIASLLMDQRVAAGVGNIYRAEVLFRQRLNPDTPGNELSVRKWRALWADLAELMPYGVRDGRIDICVVPLVPAAEDVGALVQRLLAFEPALTFLAVGGRNVPELVQRMAALRAFACVRTPLDIGTLARLVGRARGARATSGTASPQCAPRVGVETPPISRLQT